MKATHYSKIVYAHDVWRIMTGRRTHGHTSQYFFCLCGYIGEDEAFHLAIGESAPNKREIKEIASMFADSLRKYKNQKALSSSMLEFLHSPENAHEVLDDLKLYWDDLTGELIYRSVPVPIYRDDFPNRTEIILAIDTHVHLSNKPDVIRIWKDWLITYKKNLKSGNKQRVRK